MAHARLNLARMLSWIEQRLDAGEQPPTDPEICELFRFDSPEQARTLLAELADAGRITIRGYGETRTILLGRVKSTLPAATRAAPPVKKVDHQVERVAARIVEIAQRERRPAIVAANADALLKSVTPKPAPKPVLRQEKPVMPAKTIQLPASAAAAIAAVEERARISGIALGAAAAKLIERGMGVAERDDAPSAPAVDGPPRMEVDALLDMLRERFAERPDNSELLANERKARAEAVARAESAEAKLAQLKALFA